MNPATPRNTGPKHLVAAIALLAGLSGCQTVTHSGMVNVNASVTPLVGTAASVTVGGVMLSQQPVWTMRQYIIARPIEMFFALGRINISTSDIITESVKEGKPMFCTHERTYRDPLTGPQAIACLVDPNNSGRFTRVTSAPGHTVWFEQALPAPVPYKLVEEKAKAQEGLQQKVVLAGVANGSLSIKYRQKSVVANGPGEEETLSVPVTKLPTSIKLKGAEIEVTQIDSGKVSYKIIAPFGAEPAKAASR